MKIYKTSRGIVIEQAGKYYKSNQSGWANFINRDNLFKHVTEEMASLTHDATIEHWLANEIEAPVDQQEVWAAGVTYLRSRDARMEESQET